jgi:hypothetical protein
MSLNKGREIFQEATVQCLFCGRFFIKPLPHKCKTGFIKHHFKWLKIGKP